MSVYYIIYPLESPLRPPQFLGIVVAFAVKSIDVARPSDWPFEDTRIVLVL